jgi:hypothetical protein
MKDFGMDISNEVSKQLNESLLTNNMKIVIMGSKNNIQAY